MSGLGMHLFSFASAQFNPPRGGTCLFRAGPEGAQGGYDEKQGEDGPACIGLLLPIKGPRYVLFKDAAPDTRLAKLRLFLADEARLLIAERFIMLPDLICGLAQSIVTELRVACGCLRLGVAEQSTHHGQRHAVADGMAGKGVAQVVDAARQGQSCRLLHSLPQITQRGA